MRTPRHIYPRCPFCNQTAARLPIILQSDVYKRTCQKCRFVFYIHLTSPGPVRRTYRVWEKVVTSPCMDREFRIEGYPDGNEQRAEPIIFFGALPYDSKFLSLGARVRIAAPQIYHGLDYVHPSEITEARVEKWAVLI